VHRAPQLLLALLLATLVGAAGGCFHPTIEDGGFACDPTQIPSCPEGFFCVDSRCHASPGGGGSGGVDGSVGAATDMSASGGAQDLAPSQSAPDLASGSGSCAHPLCTSGSKLSSGCDACVAQICAQDSYCCTTKWSTQCVQEVTSICHRSCP
jgi:hypothetical protein